MSNKKYILGGGIAGLIWAYYNSDFYIITPEVGGQMNSYFTLGPRYLHKTPNAKKFLEELGLPIKEILIKVGYWQNGKFIVPDQEFRKKYFMKSRGIQTLDGYDDTVMNTNKNNFIALEVDFKHLISLLEERLKDKIIIDKAKKIDLVNKKIIGEKAEYEYEKLVNTISKKIFLWLCGLPGERLLAQDMTYVWLKSEYFNFEQYDFVYFLNENALCHRLTHDVKGVVADVAGAVDKETLKQHFGDLFIDAVTLKGNQIISGDVVLADSNIKFIGRYGSWSRTWKTEKVIDEAIEYAIHK